MLISRHAGHGAYERGENFIQILVGKPAELRTLGILEGDDKITSRFKGKAIPGTGRGGP
jgi:hypothetical protein